MKIQPYLVVFNLPEKLRPLQDLAMNLWFCWNWDAVELFIRLDPEEWERSNSNPVLMLGRLSLEKLEAAAADAEFVERLNAVDAKLKEYLSKPTWFQQNRPSEGAPLIAYFSMEFGIDEGIPIYSGGLGILAGDHLKSSSDLGLPLVGLGLLYQKGYFQQYLSRDGWQQERYPENDWFNMPVILERGADGKPLAIEVPMDGLKVRAQIWRVQVGRVPLYLLDTNVPENSPEQRAITASLYGGDRDMRIRQEILLGVGGVRALRALGLHPTVFHMNEGHSAFLALERLRVLMAEQGLSYAQARELVFATSVFTTHTPVPAGHEVFEPALVERYVAAQARALGFKWEDVLALGQDEPYKTPAFSMTVLALRTSAFCNGVSRLHGEVSRAMFHHLWAELPEHEVPIGHITNGAHTRSWISHDLGSLFEKHLGDAFIENSADQKLWDKVREIPAEELWALRRLRKQKLVSVVRRRLQAQLREQGADATQVRAAGRILDPETLTIGFARRFAAYKRAALILRDPERLVRLLTQSERPVQIIFAGKSHPHDSPGKELIKTLFHFTQDPRVRDRVVFLEDYDIRLARYLVQGVDVWLNNPRRPLEASGTSGMKAAVNGALNVSTLDGWWDEGYEPSLGWAIGNGEAYGESAEGDYIESEALYNLLEHEVVPLYYHRDPEGLPQEWIEMMKASMAGLGARFNTHRMILEYTDRSYLPAHRTGRRLAADADAGAKALADWRKKIVRAWPGVSLATMKERPDAELKAGDRLPITALARLGGLSPEDVVVEVYYGPLNAKGEIEKGEVLAMSPDGRAGEECRFKAEVPCRVSGRHGYAVRVRPQHPLLVQPYTPFNLAWE